MLSRLERSALFKYQDYEVLAYGTYRPGKDIWLASVCIRRTNGSVTEQNFHDRSVEFETHLAAEHFAREYAKRLIDGLEPGLRI